MIRINGLSKYVLKRGSIPFQILQRTISTLPTDGEIPHSGWYDVKGLGYKDSAGKPLERMFMEKDWSDPEDDGSVHTGGMELRQIWRQKSTHPQHEMKEGDELWWCNKVEGQPILAPYSTYGIPPRTGFMMAIGGVVLWFAITCAVSLMPHRHMLNPPKLYTHPEDEIAPNSPIYYGVFSTPTEVKAMMDRK